VTQDVLIKLEADSRKNIVVMEKNIPSPEPLLQACRNSIVTDDVEPEVGICELFHKIPCLLL
jgi:hypothetical protein